MYEGGRRHGAPPVGVAPAIDPDRVRTPERACEGAVECGPPLERVRGLTAPATGWPTGVRTGTDQLVVALV
jgi:hypothetical protein